MATGPDPSDILCEIYGVTKRNDESDAGFFRRVTESSRRRAMREITPEWSIKLPKEACRNEEDLPITTTKVSAALQHRRVFDGKNWVTLRTKEEWRSHYMARYDALAVQVAEGENLLETILAIRQDHLERLHAEGIEAANGLLELLPKLIAECKDEMEMIQRGLDVSVTPHPEAAQ